MKKLTFVAAMLLSATIVCAGAYKHSVGLSVGGLNGFEYKTFVGEHFVIAADLGVRVSQTQGLTISVAALDRDQKSKDKTQSFGDIRMAYWTFEGAANFAYQGTIADFSAGTLDWFAGGGISLGVMQGAMWDKSNHPSTHDIWDTMKQDRAFAFKLGLNAYLGAEFALKSVPLVFGLDFRPGYGESIDRRTDYAAYMDYGADVLESIAFFDWSLGATVRYYF